MSHDAKVLSFRAEDPASMQQATPSQLKLGGKLLACELVFINHEQQIQVLSKKKCLKSNFSAVPVLIASGGIPLLHHQTTLLKDRRNVFNDTRGTSQLPANSTPVECGSGWLGQFVSIRII